MNDDPHIIDFPKKPDPDPVLCEPPTPDPMDASVSFIGPFQPEHRISCGGYRVPHITAFPQANGAIALCLDGRFSKEVSQEEAKQWIWFLANAMAVAAGYSCFGSNSRKEPNPFKVQMVGITTFQP